MWINPIKMESQSKLISDYRLNKQEIMDFFEYRPNDDLEQRLTDLKKRTFQRDALKEVLHKINRNWDAPESTLHNIERIADENSVVVIAGQQAGVLTGPLYTVNKVISILQLAKQQEAKLNIPVIPVFWIAGEDHDFDEINHIYKLDQTRRLVKSKVGQYVSDKRSVSDIQIEKETIQNWLDQLFSNMEETTYTKDLLQSITTCLKKSQTYTDFFAQLIFQLFPDEGLVLIDSHHPLVRNLEKDYFAEMIQKQNEMSSGVQEALNQLKANNYAVPLDVDYRDGNLFYHQDNERILLYRDENGNWIGKNSDIVLNTNEMIEIAMHNPDKLSNNVVTRPLMQELLFPSLAFIGGPGEISYWSALKPVFDAVGIKMPPVFPRVSITYIEPKVRKILTQFNLSPEEVVNNGMEEYRVQWVRSKTKPSIEELASEIRESITLAHKPLRDLAKEIRSDIGDLAEKNLLYLQKEISFLQERMIKAVEEKYDKELGELDILKLYLHPDGLQERIWNPLPILNKFGPDFIKKTLDQPISFEHDHYIVYL